MLGIIAVFLELKDILVAFVDKIVPRFITKEVLYCFKECPSVEIEQDGQGLLICDKIDYVEHVSLEGSLQKISIWEFLALKKETKYPQQLIPYVEG